MENLNLRTISFADGCKLTPVRDLQIAMGLTHCCALRLLRYLRVPLILAGKGEWFNLLALDKVMYYLSRAGGGGFAGPGSLARDKGHGKKWLQYQLTDEDMEVIDSPDFNFQWLMLKDFTVFNRPRALRAAMTNVQTNRKLTDANQRRQLNARKAKSPRGTLV